MSVSGHIKLVNEAPRRKKEDPVDEIMLVGDTHSDIDAWRRIISEGVRRGITQYLSVGDLNIWPNVGMFNRVNNRFLPALIELLAEFDVELAFVRGNHDNLDVLETWPLHASGIRRLGSRLTYLPNGYRWSLGDRTFLALGGAYSVDENAQREQGIYSDRETVSDDDVAACIGGKHVDVLIAHDAPIGVNLHLLHADHGKVHTKTDDNTDANRKRVQLVVDAVQPSIVVFGHYHLHGKSIVGEPGDEGGISAVGLGQNGQLGGYAILNLSNFHITYMGFK